MKILFCGTNLEEKFESEIRDLSLAGNRFQRNFLSALKRTGHKVNHLSYIGVGLEASVVSELQKDADIVVKQEEGKRIFKTFYKRVLEKIRDSDIVIAYNVVYVWLWLPVLAKRKKILSVLILADYSGIESCQGFIHKFYSWLQLKSIRRYSIVIGLSKDVGRLLKTNQRFLHMEGGLNLKDFYSIEKPVKKKEEAFVLLYSGLQNKVTGIDLLLEAFETMEHAELIITGQESECTEWIKERAKRNSKIQFLGKVDYSVYLSCLNRAHILINPRNMCLQENQNNFPSKILEYLASGRVIVSTKFLGYQAFEKNCIFADSTVTDLRKKICEAMSQYDEIYRQIYERNVEKAKEFDWDHQIHKILSVCEA